MKKFILLIIGAAAICGCSKTNTDSARFDALNEKIDLLAGNQAVAWTNISIIFKQLNRMQTTLTNLPTAQQVAFMDFFVYSNLLDKLNAMDQRADLVSQLYQADSGRISTIYSNSVSAYYDLLRIQLTQDYTRIDIGYLITNSLSSNIENKHGKAEEIEWIEMQDDVFDMNTRVDDIQEDLIKIKTRLGIIY
jgi:hypothetical protein